MSAIAIKTALLLLTTSAAFLPQNVTSQLPTEPTFISVDCSSGSYGRNSTYRRNLDLLLSTLTSHASTAAFYNSSVGPTNGPDTAYGQYYCRGDVSTQLCGSCVGAAATEACTLQFDNKSNVGVWDDSVEPSYSWTGSNISDPAAFEGVTDPLIDTLIDKAVNSGQFATGEVNVSKYETVYCLVQCSPDTTAYRASMWEVSTERTGILEGQLLKLPVEVQQYAFLPSFIKFHSDKNQHDKCSANNANFFRSDSFNLSTIYQLGSNK